MKSLLVLICFIILSGCVTTLKVYHYFPETLYIEEYQLQEYRDLDWSSDPLDIDTIMIHSVPDSLIRR